MSNEERVDELAALIESGVTRIRRRTSRQRFDDSKNPERITEMTVCDEIYEALPYDNLDDYEEENQLALGHLAFPAQEIH